MVQIIVRADFFRLFRVLPFLLCSPFSFFFAHGDPSHEIEKSFAIAIWWYRANLLAIVAETFPEMLGTLDEAILDRLADFRVHTDLTHMS